MPLTPAALKTELTTDPLNLGYASYVSTFSNGDSQHSLFALLNAKNYTQNIPVPITSVLIWGAGTGVLAALKAAITNPDPVVQSIALAADTLLHSGLTETLDLTNPSIAGMLDPLVQAGVLTANQKTSLLALQVIPASRAEVLFGPGTVIGGNDVYNALAS
jgi:hypothetical protein